MGISNNEAFLHVSGDYSRIQVNRFLLYGVADRLSVFLFIQITKTAAPVVICVQRQALTRVHSVCHQFYFDGGRTVTVCVVLIIPGLGDRNVHLAWCIAVRYVVAIHNGSVILYRILGNRVRDFCSVRILRQIFPFPVPAVRCRDSLYLIGQLSAIRIQTDRDAARTLAILVVIIVPGLASFDVNCLRCVRVGYVVAPYTCCISCYCILRDRISEFLSSLILRETLVAVAPLIPSLHPGRFYICDFRLLNAFPFLIQVQRYAIRTLAILVFRIVPGLASVDVDCRRDMHVGYVVTIHNSRVILYRILGNCILNLGSCIFVLRQICEAPTPVVRCCYGLNLISQLCAICKQMNFNLAWTLAILIVIIVPGLASADIDQFFIYNYEALFSKVFYFHCKFVSADRHLSVRFANFLHTVSNFIAVTIRDWEVFPCVTPAVFCIQSHRITVLCFGSILHFTKQLNLYTCICWDIVFLYPLFSYHTARGFFFIFENNRIATGKFIQCYIFFVSFSF